MIRLLTAFKFMLLCFCGLVLIYEYHTIARWIVSFLEGVHVVFKVCPSCGAWIEPVVQKYEKWWVCSVGCGWKRCNPK